MKAIDPGHAYLVNNIDGPDKQLIRFVKRVGPGYPFNQAPEHQGTNCQELLRVLIDRVAYLDKQIAADENKEILSHLKHALWLFEARATQRHGLNPPKYTDDIADRPVCEICGHIVCGWHE